MCNGTALTTHNLSVALDEKTLFHGVSFSVKRGEKITITGRSGSGKSTLLRCILGFVPFDGEIIVQGIPLTIDSVWKVRQNMAYVAQEPELGGKLVRDVLAGPFSYKANHGLVYDHEEVDRLFDAFLLPKFLQDKEMNSLSGGEKQRIALIAALLLQRPLLLLDEAASALDSDAKKHVREYLSSRKDLAILSVSHDVHDFVFQDALYDIHDLASGVD